MTEDTRERILKAALELFSRHGFKAVGTKAIAEAADVNEVTLFRLFGSKRSLYIETFNRFKMSPSVDYLFSGFTGEAAADLLTLSRSITAVFLENDRIVRMSLKDIREFPEVDLELRSQPETMVEIVAGYFRSLVALSVLSGDCERLARHFVAVLFGLSIHFISLDMVGASYSLDDCVADFAETFYSGRKVRLEKSSVTI